MISRRDFLRATAVGAAGSLILPRILSAQAPAAAPARKLNVLFIIVDDLRPQLGCYGDKQAITPNIDKLAAQGTRFDHAYVQQALCSPSRVSMLTGCRPDTTKVYDLKTHFRTTMPDVVTLPQCFKQAGYHTQGLSKIYHPGLDDAASWSVPLWNPMQPQYASKENVDLVASKRVEAKVKKVLDEDLQRFTHGPPYECADVPDDAYNDGKTADEAVKVLGQIKDKPFFLAVGFLKPHLPFVSPKKYWDLYKRENIKVADNPNLPTDCPPVAVTNWSELRGFHGMPQEGPLTDEAARTLIHAYYAATSYTDAQIGKVIAELDRLGLRENTVIVVVGDHGWKLGEHGLWSKHTNFELDARAPMIVVAPGQKAPGKSCPGITEFVDIYPTLCGLAGLPAPKHLEGTNFAPLLDNPNLPWKSAAFSQHPRAGNMGHSIRTERYRFTLWQDPQGKLIATELYDHRADDGENANIANRPENVSLVKQLTEQLNKGWKASLPPGQ